MRSVCAPDDGWRSRYVTACQQLLALALVVAALTPAASVVSLDVVRSEPRPAGRRARRPLTAELAAYERQKRQPATVETAPVDPKVTEVQLTPPANGTMLGRVSASTSVRDGKTRVKSRPQRVVGYGAVGVTWGHGVVVGDDDIALQVRTKARTPTRAAGRTGRSSSTTTSTRPTPVAARPGAPGPAPTRCSSATSTRSRCAAPARPRRPRT